MTWYVHRLARAEGKYFLVPERLRRIVRPLSLRLGLGPGADGRLGASWSALSPTFDPAEDHREVAPPEVGVNVE